MLYLPRSAKLRVSPTSHSLIFFLLVIQVSLAQTPQDSLFDNHPWPASIALLSLFFYHPPCPCERSMSTEIGTPFRLNCLFIYPCIRPLFASKVGYECQGLPVCWTYLLPFVLLRPKNMSSSSLSVTVQYHAYFLVFL